MSIPQEKELPGLHSQNPEPAKENPFSVGLPEYVKDNALPEVSIRLIPGKSAKKKKTNQPMNELQCEV